MENVELVDIYKILLNMQSDIHRIDKKTDAISQELKETKIELREEIKATENRLREELKAEIKATENRLREELKAEIKETKSEIMEEISDFMCKDIFPCISPNYEKRISGLEEFAEARGYIKVCESECTYDSK